MHDDSQSILERLALGQEVLGINGALFSTALRAAFAEGARALDQLARVREVVGPVENTAPAHPSTKDEAKVAHVAPTAATVVVPLPVVAEVSVQPEQPTPSRAPEPATAAADELGSVATSAPTVTPSPEEEQVAAVVAEAAPQVPSQSIPADERGDDAEDDRSEPLPEQSDEPDEAGWRPSEDSMLLDEYVGLGLTVEEVAENHGRAVEDIVRRLRDHHDVDVPGYPELTVAEKPSTTSIEKAPAEEAQPAKPVVAPVSVAQPEEAPKTVEAPKAEQPAAVEPVAPAPAPTPVQAAAPVADAEPSLNDFESVIEFELKRASPDAVLFATGVLRHMERAPQAVAQLQGYLQTEKARTKLSDRLRLALLAKVVAKLKS